MWLTPTMGRRPIPARRLPWRPGRRLRVGLLADRRVQYLLAGATASLVYYAVFTAGWLISAGRIPYLAMAVIANVVTAVATYRLYRDGVFRVAADSVVADRVRGSRLLGNRVRAFLRFYAICLWSLVVTLAGLPLLVEVWRLPVLIAQALIIGVSPVVNYQMHKLWSFQHRD